MRNGRGGRSLPRGVDFDEILLYEEAVERQEEREREEKEDEAADAPATEDPIMAFVLSEEEEVEEKVEAQKGHDSNDFHADIALVPNEDIEIHLEDDNSECLLNASIRVI